jgi:hypothetical protein
MNMRFERHAQVLLWTALFWNPHYFGASELNVVHSHYEYSKKSGHIIMIWNQNGPE